MTTLALELIDDGILAIGEQGPVAGPSPGYALLEGGTLVVGDAARAAARFKPRWVDHRFWDRLAIEPMPRPFPRELSRADVAHAHLRQLWEKVMERSPAGEPVASVLVAAPGSWSADGLGLLVGIARACEIPVSGLVDAAVASLAEVPVGPRVLHLDLLLHRAVWSDLEQQGDELVRRSVEVIDESGLVAIRNAWARHIAAIMVRRTRFDPLHHGEAEQALFDRLPRWMEQLSRSSRAEVSLQSGDKSYAVEIVADRDGGVATSLLGPVLEVGRSLAAEGPLPTVAISARVAAVPGLLDDLSRLPTRGLRVVPTGAAGRGALLHRQRIERFDAALRLVSRLPIAVEPEAVLPKHEETGTHRQVPPSADAPSHILLGGTAYPILEEPLWLGSELPGQGRGLVVAEAGPGLSRRHCLVSRRAGRVVVEDHSRFGTFLNDRRVEGLADLEIGDRLRLGSPGVELRLIRVEDDV